MQNPNRRRVATTVVIAALAAAAAALPGTVAAFPDKPVTLVIGFPPGGAGDTISRALADEMSRTLGQRVIVDNKPGAGGNIATTAVLNAPADGYTLLFAGINLATAPALSGVRYDPAADLQMVAQMTSVPVLMLVSGKSRYQSPADVLKGAKAETKGMSVGTGGNGTSGHLALELLARHNGVPFVHVPYRGGAAANTALIGGEVEMIFDLGSATLKGFIDAGTIRPLAVMQGNRVSSLPNVKSAKEQGLPDSTHIRSWQGIAVKAGTPKAVVQRLHQAINAAVDTPAFRARAWQLGSEVVVSKSPDEFQRFYLGELDRWGAVIKAAGMKP
jgi:tripartite-type tricarboxylate transporter receptor subunit TctC